ncbi:MAG TPA: response regulator [Caulobacteraceae bacterium]
MASPSQIIARACEDLLGPMRETSLALDRLRQCSLDPQAMGHCQAAVSASGKVLLLLETASELQKVEAGQMVLTPQPRRLRELMDEVDSRWRAASEQSGVSLMVSYDGDPECAVMVDWDRLLLVFDALVARALANVGLGVVEASLATRLSDDGVVIACRVRDDGALLATRGADQLSAASSSHAGEGIGVSLGLVLASHVVTAMGGRLETQANVGAGATLAFEVTLKAPRTADENPDARAPGGRAAHILVVDDNATNRMVVEALCAMFECSTESVTDGVEAVEAARVGRFDVILMDIKMPRMDGLTATREIRKLRGAAGRPPIVALTANAGADDVQAYLAAGMCGVVEKPIKAERLLAALENALATGPTSVDATAAA